MLVDGERVVSESSIIVEYLDRHGDAPPLIPGDPAVALRARWWDRVADGYLAGEDFTLADCSAAPALHYADVLHPLLGDAHPGLAAYFARLRSRPSVARVIEEARPYRAFFPLPWPDRVP